MAVVYRFSQNNSGGFYTGPARNIIVKGAESHGDAVGAAEKAGMYLDGVKSGRDCECCGDRWHGTGGEFDTLDEAIECSPSSSEDGVPRWIAIHLPTKAKPCSFKMIKHS